MFFYRVPSADEAMLVSGYRVKSGAAPFRVVSGDGAFVIPLLRRATILPLGVQDVDVQQTCYERQGIELVVHATASFKVTDVVAAGQRFASHPERMGERVARLFGDRLARVAGTMSIEELAISSRQQFVADTVELADSEMAKIGLACDGLAVTRLDDHGEGYIAAMGAPRKAAMHWGSLIARAQTDRAAINTLVERAAQLPDGRDIGELASEAVQHFAAIAQPNGNGQ